MDNNNKIQELRDRYKSGFVEKAEAINKFLLVMSTGDSRPINGVAISDMVYLEIHEFMHKLAGSSGMYGYPDIASLSREAMDSSNRNEPQLLLEQLSGLRDLLQKHA